MITINYQAFSQGPTAKHLIYIRATGTTPEDVKTDALQQADAIGATELVAVGLHNREADWVAAFGSGHSPDCRFADSPQVRPSVWPQLLVVLIMAMLLWLASIGG